MISLFKTKLLLSFFLNWLRFFKRLLIHSDVCVSLLLRLRVLLECLIRRSRFGRGYLLVLFIELAEVLNKSVNEPSHLIVRDYPWV